MEIQLPRNAAAMAVMKMGARRSVGASADRFPQLLDALVPHQVLDVRNQHDAVPRGDAEQCNEADDRSH